MDAKTNGAMQVWAISDEYFTPTYSLHQLLRYHGVEDFSIGEVVYFGERAEHGTDWIDADDVIELIACRADDEASDLADGFPEVSDQAVKELDEFLTEWQAKYCRANFFRVENVQRYTITADDLAALSQEPQ